MRGLSLLSLCALAAMQGGCVAKTLVDVATLPVRAGSKAVDLATTSQSESDEKRGREIRKREEEAGKLQRKYDKQIEDCQDGDRRACSDAQNTYAQLQTVLRSIPAPPPED